MQRGRTSITAQRVAAQRLRFERVPAPYGDPDADERLARDVAGDAPVRESRMSRYLAARTRFFDHVVVAVLEAGVAQVVVAAAGYDGRAWRYAKPGVRWLELDHPDTQRDKRERVQRLGLTVEHVSFVSADFAAEVASGSAAGEIGPRLRAGGLDPERPALILCEGVAVYLERPVLTSLLAGLRSVAAPGSRLAISLSVRSGSPLMALRRARFRARVAAVGEPARTVLRAADAAALLSDTGWQPRRLTDAGGGTRSDRARAAGFVVATPA